MNGRNVMNIPVPDVGFTDLGNSYAVFRVQPSVTDTTNGVSKIYPMVFADPTHGPTDTLTQYTGCTGQALVRNTRVTYEKAQIQNERIEQNVLHQNMDWHTVPRANQSCKTVLDGSNTYNYGQIGGSGLPNSPFIQYSRLSVLPAAGTGALLTTPSQMRNADIRVPMKHLDQLADGMHQFPMTAFGKANYYIQLENVINVVAPAQMPQKVACDNLTLAVDANVGSANNPIKITELYANNDRLMDVPLYVGAPLNITITAGGNVVPATSTVASLQCTAAGSIWFTLTTPIASGVAAGQVVSLISFSYQGYDALAAGVRTYNYPSPLAAGTANYVGISASWQITNAWIELHELKLLPEQQKAALEALRNMELPYLETRTIKKNMLQTTTEYSDVVPYDVGCVGLAVMTPQSNTLTSGFDSASQYRHKVNSNDVQGRWVIVGPEMETTASLPVGRQLHNYLMQTFFANYGQPLKKFDAPWSNYIAYNDTNTHAFYPLVINEGQQNGIVGLNVQTNGTMQQKQVYWQFLYQRAVQIKNGQVVAVL